MKGFGDASRYKLWPIAKRAAYSKLTSPSKRERLDRQAARMRQQNKRTVAIRATALRNAELARNALQNPV